VSAATRVELEQAQASGAAAQVALVLAARLDDATTPASALPALARQLGAAIDRACAIVEGGKRSHIDDLLEELLHG